MSRSSDNTTRNVLHYFNNQKYYKLIRIYLSRKTDATISQQINFIGKLEKNYAAKKFFLVENQYKTVLKFCLRSLKVAK